MTKQELSKIADIASADPATVARVLCGIPTRPRVQARIERALRELGLPLPVAPSTEAAK